MWRKVFKIIAAIIAALVILLWLKVPEEEIDLDIYLTVEYNCTVIASSKELEDIPKSVFDECKEKVINETKSN
ncbi:MAG: hypothetical protein ACOVLB_02910 [Candidatus Nanopelagicus sp.]